MTSYIEEAFKSLSMLNEDAFEFNDADIADDVAMLRDEQPVLDIIDAEAETEDDLQDNYIGKVILECSVCHSLIYKNKEDVFIDEETNLVNVGEECPYCYTTDGCTVVGQVVPFEEESDTDIKSVEVDGEPVEVEETEIVEESLRRSSRKRLKESSNSLQDLAKQAKECLNAYAICYGVKYKGKLQTPTDSFVFIANDADEYRKKVQEYCNGKPERDFEFYTVFDRSIKNESLGNKLSSRRLQEARKRNACKSLHEGKNWEKIKKAYDIKEACKEKDLDEAYVEEWWGQTDANPYDLKKYGLTVTKLDTRADETLYRFEGKKSDIEKAMNDGYFYSVDYDPETKIDLEEDFESATIETDSETMTMTTNPDGGVTVTTNPKSELDDYSDYNGDEMIEPLEDEDMEEIELEQGIDTPDEPIDMEDEESEDDEEVEVSLDDFDEESFDELGESYLRKVYENVNSYKTTKVALDDKVNKLKVEGLIGFNSGKTKKTQFMFEADSIDKNGKAKFFGENLQFTRGKKSFNLSGKITEGRLVCESLSYNYRAKIGEGKSTRVYGTAKLNESRRK